MGRAGLQATGAAPAEVGEGDVRRQVEGEEELAQEEPGARLRMEQVRVLAHGPEAGPRRELTLQDRAGIYIAPRDGPRERRGDPVLQRLEALSHDVVVVTPPGIAGDPGPEVVVRLRLSFERMVLESDTESAPGAGHDPGRLQPGFDPLLEPAHPRLVPARQPAQEGVPMGGRLQPRHPGAVETGFERPRFEEVGGGIHGRDHKIGGR
jgi:hypothetical protein